MVVDITVSYFFMRKVISCERLSKLQRLLLVMLSEPGIAVLKRRQFNRVAMWLYWGKESRVNRLSLGRALRRLETRNCVRRSAGRWVLTEGPLGNSGVELAFLAWAREQEFWGRFGLKGPRREALVVKTKISARPGVLVELNCDEL